MQAFSPLHLLILIALLLALWLAVRSLRWHK